MKELIELTNDTGMANWIPTEGWADLILEASVCYGQLSGVITAVDYDLAAGNGNTVRVRIFPPRVAQNPGGTTGVACNCLSAVSSTLDHADITITTYGDYDKICGFSLYKAKGPVKEGILNEMAKGLASARDGAILTALLGSNAYTITTTVSCNSVVTQAGSCCDYRYNLFNSIVSIAAEMKDACFNPDYVILNPSVAKWFYIGDRGASGHHLHLQFDGNDKLISIAGMKVIETGLAPSCSGSGDATMAIIIDSSRAVGEAWGKRPTFTEDYVPECDYFKEVVWMYWGTSRISVGGIAHVRNP